MAQTLNQLFEQPDFISGSYAKRQALFSDWKVTELTPYMQPLDRLGQRSMLREVEDYFNEVVPPPEEPGFFDFSDAGTALSAGTDQAQAIVGEVGIQLTQLEKDAVANPGVDYTGVNQFDIGAVQDAIIEQDANPIVPTEAEKAASLARLDEREVNLQDFVDANVQEGADERKGFSDYVKDKQRELQEAQDAETTDSGKAAATLGFYLGGTENLDMLGLLALESAPSSAAAMGVTAAGGLVGGVPGAMVAGAAVEGALGAGEASLGAYQTALKELKKQGIPEAEAKKRAREASRTAAAIGGAASAALGPVSEVLPVIRSFRKATPKKITTVDTSGVGRTVTEVGGGPTLKRRIGGAAGAVAAGTVGEFAQGAAVQVAENIAVDPITPTDTFDGALLAGTTEALAGGATTATMQGVGSAGRALTNERRLGNAKAAEERRLGAELETEIDNTILPDEPIAYTEPNMPDSVDTQLANELSGILDQGNVSGVDPILVTEATDKATEIMSTVDMTDDTTEGSVLGAPADAMSGVNELQAALNTLDDGSVNLNLLDFANEFGGLGALRDMVGYWQGDATAEGASLQDIKDYIEASYGIETEAPIGEAATSAIEQPDSADDSGGIDSPSSDLPIAPATSPASDSGAIVAPLPTDDSGSVSPAASAVPVPEQPPSTSASDVTSTTQQTPAAAIDTGNGATVPTLPETQPSSDGSSSTASAGVNGATGESSGDIAPEVVALQAQLYKASEEEIFGNGYADLNFDLNVYNSVLEPLYGEGHTDEFAMAMEDGATAAEIRSMMINGYLSASKAGIQVPRKNGGFHSEGTSFWSDTPIEDTSKSPDITQEVVRTYLTAKGSVYQSYADGTTVRDKSDHTGPLSMHEATDVGIKDKSAKTIYVTAENKGLSWAGMGSDVSGYRAVLKDGKVTIVSPNPQTRRLGAAASQRDVPFFTEPAVGLHPIELWQPTDVNGQEAYRGIHEGNAITEIMDAPKSPDIAPEVVVDEVITDLEDVPQFAEEAQESEITPQTEWDKYTKEGDIPYNQLSQEEKQVWDDNVWNYTEVGGVEDSWMESEVKRLAGQNKNWKPTQATAPVPSGTIDYMRNGGEPDTATAEYIKSNPLPLVVDGGTPQTRPIIPQADIDTPLNIEGEAGIVNAAVKATKPTGTYIIADPATEQAYIMSPAGVLQATVPLAAAPLNAPVHAVAGSDGNKVLYQHVQAKGDKSRYERSSKESLGQYEGIVAPPAIQAHLRPKKNPKQKHGANFSGNVYVLQGNSTVEPTNPLPLTAPVSSTKPSVEFFESPLSPASISFITSSSDDVNLIPAQQVIATLLADPLTRTQYPQYRTMLEAFSGNVDAYRMGHGLIDDAGSHSGLDSKIMLHTSAGMNYHTIAHELSHAATEASFHNRSARTEPIWEQILEAYELLKGFDALEAYGFDSPVEFVAELYANPNFRSALDTIQGVKKDKTLWDVFRDLIAGDLLQVETEFSAEQLSDWVEALFLTNAQLQVDGMIPLGDRGRTASDLIEGRHSTDLQNMTTRSGIARAARAARANVRNVIMDDSSLFLKWLGETRLPTLAKSKRREASPITGEDRWRNGDHDSYEAWVEYNLSVGRRRDFIRKFDDNHLRRIENQSDALYRKFKGNGLSQAEVMEQGALFATFSHIPTATRVARRAIESELAEAASLENEMDVNIRSGMKIDPDVEMETRAATNRFRKQLAIFDEIQGGVIRNPDRTPTELMALAADNVFAVQGGMTVRESKLALIRIAERVAGPDGDQNAAFQDLQLLKWTYVEANRDLWEQGIATGEVSQEQAAIHANSGLDVDYIPLTGGDTHGVGAGDAYQRSFGSTGALRAPISSRRKGRLTPPENAHESLQRNRNNMAARIATRPFKEQLLADINSGLIPTKKATARLLKGKAQYSPTTPAGIQPIYLRTEEGTWQMWIEGSSKNGARDLSPMLALNGISGDFDSSAPMQIIGRTTRFYAKMYTFASMTFAPASFLMEGWESLFNLSARNLTWEETDVGTDYAANGVKVVGRRTAKDDQGADVTKVVLEINRKVLVGNVSANAWSPGFLFDTMRVLAQRKVTDIPTADESHLVRSPMGKMLLEAEAAGAINVEIDSVSSLWQNQDIPKADLAALKRLADYAGEMQATVAKDGKLSKAATKALVRQVQATAMRGGKGLNAILSFWNTMFDVRVKTAVYAALVKQGMPSNLAAARTLDLANYNKQGQIGNFMSAIMPFYRPAVFGSANAIRSMLFSPRGLPQFIGATTLLMGLYALLMLIAGEEEDDPAFPYNRLDAVPALTIRGAIPIVIPGDGKDDDIALKIPAPYGAIRVAWSAATQMMRSLRESPLERKDDGLSEFYKVVLQETVPLPISPTDIDGQNLFKFMSLAFTPAILQGPMSTAFNINSFASPVDFAVDSSKPGYTQGYFRTQESWKRTSQWLYDKVGINWTPQQTRGYVSGFMPGVLSALPNAMTQGDKEAKGFPWHATDDLGWGNLFALSRLYSRIPPPEENVAYSLRNEFNKERMEFATPAKAKQARKPWRGGRPPSAKAKTETVWEWNVDKLAAAGKLHYLEDMTLTDEKGKPYTTTMAERTEAFEKEDRASKKRQNAKHTELEMLENAARNTTANEAYAYGVGFKTLNEGREFFDIEYENQRAAFRRYIVDMREMRKKLDVTQ